MIAENMDLHVKNSYGGRRRDGRRDGRGRRAPGCRRFNFLCPPSSRLPKSAKATDRPLVVGNRSRKRGRNYRSVAYALPLKKDPLWNAPFHSTLSVSV